MPNWVHNTLEIEGPDEERERFYASVEFHEAGGDVTPVSMAGEDIGAVWGPERDARDAFINTRWSPPIEEMRRVSAKFPSLRFHLYASSVESDFKGWADFQGGMKTAEAWGPCWKPPSRLGMFLYRLGVLGNDYAYRDNPQPAWPGWASTEAQA